MNGKQLQKMINSGESPIMLPEGRIDVDEPIELVGNCVHIVGRGIRDYRSHGPGGTYLKAHFGDEDVLVMKNCPRAILQDFTITSNRPNDPPRSAIRLSRDKAVHRHTFTRLLLCGFFDHACVVSVGSEGNTWDGCVFEQWQRGELEKPRPAFYTGSWDRFAGALVGEHGAASNLRCVMRDCAFSIPRVTGEEGPNACAMWIDWMTGHLTVYDPFFSVKFDKDHAAARVPCVIRVGNTDGQPRYSSGQNHWRPNECGLIKVYNPLCDGYPRDIGFEHFLISDGTVYSENPVDVVVNPRFVAGE